MTIKGKNRTIDIPGWAVFMGLLVVDNVAANVCKVKCTKILQNSVKNGKSN